MTDAIASGFIEIDDVDDDAPTVYMPATKVRVFLSKNQMMKWILGQLERGVYFRRLRLTPSDGEIHEAQGTHRPADPELRNFRKRENGVPGRKPARKRPLETDDEKTRRQNRERSARHRERERQAKLAHETPTERELRRKLERRERKALLLTETADEKKTRLAEKARARYWAKKTKKESPTP